MSRRWAGCIFGLIGGLLAGVAFEIGILSAFSGGAWAISWEQWGYLPSVLRADLLSYPTGAALAGLLAAWGLIRWRSLSSSVVIIAVSSLLGATVAVAGSVLLHCIHWGFSNTVCSGMAPLRLAIEAPTMWILLAAVVTVLGLLARWINGPVQPTPSEQRS